MHLVWMCPACGCQTASQQLSFPPSTHPASYQSSRGKVLEPAAVIHETFRLSIISHKSISCRTYPMPKKNKNPAHDKLPHTLAQNILSLESHETNTTHASRTSYGLWNNVPELSSSHETNTRHASRTSYGLYNDDPVHTT